MVVTVVLICIELGLWFGSVVHASLLTRGLPSQWRTCRNNGGSLRKIQMHVAFEANGKTEIISGRKHDHATARRFRRADCRVYGRSIQMFSISGRSMSADVKKQWGCVRGGARFRRDARTEQ